MDIRVEGDDMPDFYGPYDGEVSHYLLRARKWIGRADVLAINNTTPDRANNMATIGIAYALLAAVIVLVKESPPSD